MSVGAGEMAQQITTLAPAEDPACFLWLLTIHNLVPEDFTYRHIPGAHTCM